ncbi:polyprenol phosphomannose-dependent alpha 1,6 mannosyltransferase MptB [Demetria terragena]|uniref:polyprenol phosphomannose-dependent alpha 1,6 mannosyltransferase MptB n=1 Tax=Demetria terragena TaxID=63959 RepID=UPI00035F6E20|nr:polyprenol phosphomannose-dependent alpha 1,6 mannosyltransferase MptB [Demetria terragena]
MKALAPARIPLLLVSFGLLLLVGAAKANAAKPPLGTTTWLPEMGYYPSARAVTILLFGAYIAGALAVLAGLARPLIARRATAWVLLLGALVLLTSPIGSGDHTNYAAYGRIAIQGGDPYSASPEDWRGGLDPITASVQPPWRDTPSIYGPFATALMAVSSWIGGDNLRLTVGIWQVFIVGAWLAMRWLLFRLCDGERAQGRVDVLWTFNPLVFGPLVLGAHVDLIAAALAVAALVALPRSPLVAGMFVGAAASTKVTYAVVALGIVWAWRAAVLRHPAWRVDSARGRLRQLVDPWRTSGTRERVRDLVIGALAVVVPCYLVAGPHVLKQLGAAGGSFSFATPAAPLWIALRHVLPEWAVGAVVFVLAASAMIGLAWLLHRVAYRVRLGRRIPDAITRQAVVTTWALSTAYVFCAPYALPWYDALVWALLPILLEMAWDAALVGRALFMVLAYVPGRVLGLSPGVEAFTLNFRINIAPWFTTLFLVLLVWLCWRELHRQNLPPIPPRKPPLQHQT